MVPVTWEGISVIYLVKVETTGIVKVPETGCDNVGVPGAGDADPSGWLQTVKTKITTKRIHGSLHG